MLSDMGKAWKFIGHVARFWRDSAEQIHHDAQKIWFIAEL